MCDLKVYFSLWLWTGFCNCCMEFWALHDSTDAPHCLREEPNRCSAGRWILEGQRRRG